MDQNVNEFGRIPLRNYCNRGESRLFMLNHDCFMAIFSYLDLFELCVVAKTCKYFSVVARHQLRNRKTFNIRNVFRKEYSTTLDARLILKQCGSYLTTLIWNMDFPGVSGTQLIKLLSRYCTRLRHVTFDRMVTLKNHKTLKQFIKIVEVLESLELINCYLTDDIGELLESGKCLINLNLSLNPTLTGRCLSKLYNLKSLNLDMCHNIEPVYFAHIFKNNKNLEYLNVRSCRELNAQNFQEMIKQSTNLTHLVMSNFYPSVESRHLPVVAKIPNLKRLEIMWNGPCTSEYVDSLFINLVQFNKLEYLALYGTLLNRSYLEYLKYFTGLKIFVFRPNPYLVDSTVMLDFQNGIIKTHS